ncbi:acyltransferase [Lewinellaceae bacterium SD302]|nr:acyltransferase [Lewinellaceae bacterium SD302]
MRTAKHHIYPLTSLRFFFALAVFFHHCYFITKRGEVELVRLYDRFFSEGYIGVSFFFLLSGFILAYNYGNDYFEAKGKTLRFYIARFARIYPLHLLTFMIMIPVSLHDLVADSAYVVPLRLFTQFTLTQSLTFSEEYYSTFNSPAWSISTEAVFYLAFPALIIASTRIYKRLGQLSYLLLILCLGLVPLGMLLTPEDWYHSLFYVSPLTRLFDFLIGIFLLFAFLAGKPEAISRWLATVLEIAGLSLLYLFIACSGEVGAVYRYSAYYWLPMAAVIYVFSFQRGWISVLLSGRIFIILGKISFAFYLLHQPCIRYFNKFRDLFFSYQNAYLDMLIIFCITLVTSYLVYRFFERPVNRWIRATFADRAN